MKFIWEKEDIIMGRRYSKKGIGESFIIGYLVEPSQRDSLICSISLLDGNVITYSSKEILADILTQEGYHPYEIV